MGFCIKTTYFENINFYGGLIFQQVVDTSIMQIHNHCESSTFILYKTITST